MATRNEDPFILAGIFVGGKGERLGGVPKGLLKTSSGETLVDRWRRLFTKLGVRHVLVGQHVAYGGLGFEILDDEMALRDASGSSRSTLGPLGGVMALLTHTQSQATPGARAYAIAVACDMPFVEVSLVRALIEAPHAPLVAARRDERWEPFFARYECSSILPIARGLAKQQRTSLQALCDAAPATSIRLDLDERAQLDDWDCPEDVTSRPA